MKGIAGYYLYSSGEATMFAVAFTYSRKNTIEVTYIINFANPDTMIYMCKAQKKNPCHMEHR